MIYLEQYVKKIFEADIQHLMEVIWNYKSLPPPEHPELPVQPAPPPIQVNALYDVTL